MAVTLQGTFVILDRASGPMRRMEEQAKRTDKAINSVGDSMDKWGSNKTLRNLENADRGLRNVDRSTRRLGGPGGSVRVLSRDTDDLHSKLTRLGAQLGSLGRIFKVLKIPAIIAAFGGLVQVIGALSAGVIALLPKVTDLAGAGVGLTSTFAGLGLAMTTVKLATKDVGQALGGNEQAIKRLTPRAREFVATLADMRPIMQDLRNAAQQGLFPGLTAALQRLQRGAPLAERLLGRMGRALGRGATRGANMLTSPQMMRDLGSLGNDATRSMDRLIRGLLNLVHAMVDVMVAARPFTNWLERTILGWTRWARESAAAGRETGRLGRYFDRVRDSLETFGRILHNIWDIFRGLGHAARATGDSMWHSIDRVTKRWADWSNSFRGQNVLQRWFLQARPAISETMGLFGDILKGLFQLSSGPQGTAMIRGLRSLVPELVTVTRSVMQAFGPTMVDSLRTFAEMFATLVLPFAQFGRIVNQLLHALNWMMTNIPGLTNVVAGLIAVMTFRKLFGSFDGLIGRWRVLRGEIVATNTAAVVGGRGAMAGGLTGRAAGQAAVANMMGGAAVGAGVGRFAAGRAALGAGARALGRFAGPAALAFGISDAIATPGGIGERVQGAVSGATLGIVPAPLTTEQLRAKGAAGAPAAMRGVPRGGAGIPVLQERIGRLRSQAMQLGSSGLGGRMAEQIKGVLPALRQELQLRREIVHTMAIQRGDRAGADLAKAFDIFASRRGPLAAAHRTLADIGSEIHNLGPVGGREMAKNMLIWAREQEKAFPKLKGFYADMRREVRASFHRMGADIVVFNDQIFRSSDKAWAAIKTAISSRAEQARQDTQRAFTAIQMAAVNALTQMGFSRSEARNVVGNAESGGTKRGSAARSLLSTGGGSAGSRTFGGHGGTTGGLATGKNAGGGRIPGRGFNDTVPVAPGQMAAPGELIVNRHTERRVDHALRMFGTSLSSQVATEGRKHWQSEIASHGAQPIGPILPGLAFGGRAGSAFRAGAGTTGGGPGGMGSMMLAARSIEAQHYPYLWGGGHNAQFSPPYDCSGAVSAVLHAGGYLATPMTSGNLMNWGAPGPGAVTIFANQGHTFMRLGQSYFGTSTSNPGGGAGFFPPPGAGYEGRFTQRHAPGLGGSNTAGTGFGGGALQSVSLHAPRSALGGAPGGLVNAAGAIYASGLQRSINRQLGGGGGGGSMRGLNHRYPPGVALSPTTVARIASAAGLPGRTFEQIAHGESNYQPGAISPDGGYGLWQMTPRVWGAGTVARMNALGGTQAMLNPLKNAQMAKILYDQAGHSISPWYGTKFVTGAATGGRVPWFGGGGDFVATRPQIIGVGDGGRERVTVSAAGKGGGGGGVRIGRMVIHNHRPGDVREAIKREVSQAFHDLNVTLDNEPVEDAEELV